MGDERDPDSGGSNASPRAAADAPTDVEIVDGGPARSRDGRTARRQRNVDAALDALLELIAEGHVDPTVETVADRAGVSHRSLYRYFETRTGMLEAAFDRVMEQLAPLLHLEREPTATFDTRAKRFVDARVAGFMGFRLVGRTAMMNRTHDFIREKIDESRAVLREQLADQFAPELDELPPEERPRRLLLADVVFQFESLEYLFEASGSSGESLADVLHAHLAIVLAAD